jgi:hypothetical protein
VTLSQYCWSVMSRACMEACLPSRNLETDCVTPLYYLETADSVAQPFLHGTNTLQYCKSLLYGELYCQDAFYGTLYDISSIKNAVQKYCK